MRNKILSLFAVFVLVAAVATGVVLVKQEQDIRDKAASGSDCTHAPDCVLLEDVGDIGSYNAPGTILYVEFSDQDYHRYYPGDSDDCRKVNISGNMLSWERLQHTNECKNISNIQIWFGEGNSSPSPSSSSSPTSSPTSSPVSSSPPQTGCPLVPQTGQVLVNFSSKGLRSDLDVDASKGGPYSVNLPAGVYKVILASSDDYNDKSEIQNKEQYYVKMFDANGTFVVNTNSIDDLPADDFSKVQTVNENLVVSAPITKLEVHHSAYFLGESPNSIHAECAIFERTIVSTSAQCNEVKVFDENWSRFLPEDYSKLVPGTKIRLTISGTTNDGSFDKARFIINGQSGPEVTTKRPGTNEFYYEYQISSSDTQLSVKGEVHHSSLGWL